jgi:serine/threonine protein kinase
MLPEAFAKSGRRYPPIGKYELVGHIATGGMGTIYKAIDSESGTVVALKVLAPTLAAKPNVLERFRREARQGIKLRHENLVAIHDWGEENGIYYLALEYIQGIDLHEYINRLGCLHPEEAHDLVIQATKALAYLHGQQIVHRDIKPSNFMLLEIDDLVLLKLTDLGVAREISEDEFRVTQEGFTVGTVDYMAPEQARDSGLADIRSDIYSLGCTLHHMLTGRPPFWGGGLTERLFKHAEDDPPDVREINPAVSFTFAAVLRRMLGKKPADRYQTPAELLEALERVDPMIHTEEPPTEESLAREQLAEPPPPPEPAPEPVVPVDIPYPDTVRLPWVLGEHRQDAAKQFERAGQQAAAGKVDEAIRLLLNCCKLDPANLLYRQTLRRLSRAGHPPDAPPPGWGAWFKGLAARFRLLTARQAGDARKVLESGEEVLSQNPWDIGTQIALAEAAELLRLIHVAVWILEQAWDKTTHTPDLDRVLARLYARRGNLRQASILWRQVLKADPQNLEAKRQIQDLAARETIARGQYEDVVDGDAEETSI